MSYGEKGKQFISEKKAKDKTMSADTGFILRLSDMCHINILTLYDEDEFYFLQESGIYLNVHWTIVTKVIILASGM